MADSYVCSGATMKCSMGTSQAKLTVLPSRTVFLTGQPMANISDHLSMVNLAPFGRCRSLGFPATASATAANHGSLTPMPCMHNTPFPWTGGKNDYKIRDEEALLKSSTCPCMWGGTISIVDDGQTDTGAAELSRKEFEEFEKDQVKTDGLNTEDILDGIQMALDVAGMVPVLGAAPDLLNAAISALRGNWLDAGMSLVAAVPGAGDAVGGTKIVKNGVKLAKNVQKNTKTTGTVVRTIKNSENISKNTGDIISMGKRKAAKLDKQLVESDRIAKLPVNNNSASNKAAEKVSQKNNNAARIDNYKVEVKKQANGSDIRTVKKVSDKEILTIKNSSETGGINSSPSGFDNSYNVNSIKSVSKTGTTTDKKGASVWNQRGQDVKKPVEGKEVENVLNFSKRTPLKDGDGKKLDIII